LLVALDVCDSISLNGSASTLLRHDIFSILKFNSLTIHRTSCCSSVRALLKFFPFMNNEGRKRLLRLFGHHTFNMIGKINNFILVIDFVVIRIPIEHLVPTPLISFIEKAVFNVLVFDKLRLVIIY
jgi:hypothetical protein